MNLLKSSVAFLLFGLFSLKALAVPAEVHPTSTSSKIQAVQGPETALLITSVQVLLEAEKISNDRNLLRDSTSLVYADSPQIFVHACPGYFFSPGRFAWIKPDFLSAVDIAFPFTTFW